ncbi:MAG TPA: osmoprotectant ABC transporter substrate-binding protein [Firmicutes bacterium]|nr:osmoprotectant ABC transporter substrate-binding protein [Bacillota bacterium]
MSSHKTWFVKVIAIGLGGVLSAALLTGCRSTTNQEKIVIASHSFSEPQILAELVKQLVEKKVGITVEHKRNFQGSTALHKALESGDIQMYNAWTGTQFTGILQMEVTREWKDRRKVYEYVRDRFHEKYKVKVLEPYGFNNTYALAVRKETAEKLGLKKASDLIKHAPSMTVAVDQTFQERKGDGWADLAQAYGFKFKKVVTMTYDLVYQAIKSGDVDVAVAYSTDGRVAAYNLVTLEDDRGFFPPYDGVLFVREDTLQRYPEIEQAVKPLIGRLTDAEMAALNREVDVNKRDPADVAREYLKSKGLI